MKFFIKDFFSKLKIIFFCVVLNLVGITQKSIMNPVKHRTEYDGDFFSKKKQQIKLVNYFQKNLHHRTVTGF